MIEFPHRIIIDSTTNNFITFSISSIVSAFSKKTIGTKIKSAYQKNFLINLAFAINEHDFNADTIPGQAILSLTNANKYVLPGVGKATNVVSDYVLRSYRGKVGAYLKRSYTVLCKVINVRCVVYTKAAYLADPDINETPGEAERIIKENPSHVLVAILSDLEGKKNVLSPHRFVLNLAGGNNLHMQMSADQI